MDEVPAALEEKSVGGRACPRRLEQVFDSATILAADRVRLPCQTAGVELFDVVLVPVPLPVMRRVDLVLRRRPASSRGVMRLVVFGRVYRPAEVRIFPRGGRPERAGGRFASSCEVGDAGSLAVPAVCGDRPEFVPDDRSPATALRS